MKLIVTLDYYDGRKGKSSKPVPIDQAALALNGMFLRYFTDSEICGVTITKYEPLETMVDKLD